MSQHATHHSLLISYLDHLRARGKSSTAACYDQVLGYLTRWLVAERLDAATATTEQLARFQVHIAAYCTATGEPLAKSTQGTITAVLRSAYGWLHRRGRILHDPARSLAIPQVPRRLSVAKEFLTQDECVALLATLTARMRETTPGTTTHALAQRDGALIALAIASGMRSHTLLGLRVDHIDREACAIRIEISKGKTGRVIPTARWAIMAVDRWLSDGRAHLLRGATSDYLFVSQRRGRMGYKAYASVLAQALARTGERHPDLADALAAKSITTHGLRVSTALLLHEGRCDVRSISELLLHGTANAPGLAVTARYLPTTTDDLARALRGAHPRW